MESDIRKYYQQDPVEALQFTQDSKDEILKRLEQHNVQYLESKAMADSGQLRNGQGDLLGQIGLDDWVVFEFDGSMRIMNNPTFKAHYRAGEDHVDTEKSKTEPVYHKVFVRPEEFDGVTLTDKNIVAVAKRVGGRVVSYGGGFYLEYIPNNQADLNDDTPRNLIRYARPGDVLIIRTGEFSSSVHDRIPENTMDTFAKKYIDSTYL
jgi:hypothetical protein